MESCAPIVLFVFNRKSHVERAISALKKNALCGESDLYIYADGARDACEAADVAAVREYCRSITGFASVDVIEREANYGVERNEIEALDEMFASHDACIILEDDVEVGSRFLEYMNRALDFYRDKKDVMEISAYTHIDRLPDGGARQRFYFSQLISAWGWATWADRWKLFDVNATMESVGDSAARRRFDLDGAYPFTEMLSQQLREGHVTWDLAWYVAAFRNNKISLTPAYTMANNIGMDGSGVHYNDGDVTENEIRQLEREVDFDFPMEVRLDEYMRKMEKKCMGRHYRMERTRYRMKKLKGMLFKSAGDGT